MAPDKKFIPIEIIRPDPKHFLWICLFVEPNTTLQNILSILAECNLAESMENASLGIWGEIKSLDTAVHIGDRVEIMQPLLNDPKTLRQIRAKQEVLEYQQKRRLKKQLKLSRRTVLVQSEPV